MNRHCGGTYFRLADSDQVYYRCLLDSTVVPVTSPALVTCPHCRRPAAPWHEGRVLVAEVKTVRMFRLPPWDDRWEILD